jgi:hypothetical protein
MLNPPAYSQRVSSLRGLMLGQVFNSQICRLFLQQGSRLRGFMLKTVKCVGSSASRSLGSQTSRANDSSDAESTGSTVGKFLGPRLLCAHLVMLNPPVLLPTSLLDPRLLFQHLVILSIPALLLTSLLVSSLPSLTLPMLNLQALPPKRNLVLSPLCVLHYLPMSNSLVLPIASLLTSRLYYLLASIMPSSASLDAADISTSILLLPSTRPMMSRFFIS